MRVRLCGAAGEVTGSGYLVETADARVLVDFGAFQGYEEARDKNHSLGPVDPARLDAVVLTHAHLDHVGRLPLLVASGYRGPIFSTAASLDLAELVIRDSVMLELADLARVNRVRQAAGKKPIEPLTTLEDLAKLASHTRPIALGSGSRVAPGITVRPREAEHILGSASIEMTVEEGDVRRTVVFSGDVGPRDAPILRAADPPERADLVFLESTYGDRDHTPREETVRTFYETIARALHAQHRVLIPAFAIGRTQMLLYYISEGVRSGKLPRAPVYVDSPMALRATQAYREHRKLYDREATALVKVDQFDSDDGDVRFVESADESKRLNGRLGSCVIIAASGMCEGGRIVHHLLHGLPRTDVEVLIVGYMGVGTLGRELKDGAREVRIFDDAVPVRAKIHAMDGFSAHAGQTDLLHWLGAMAASRPATVLTHGEDPQRHALRDQIRERFGIEAQCPYISDVITLERAAS